MKGRALFVGAHERVVHQILGINIVTCEQLSIATQSRKPAEDVEASLSTYHDECTEPRTKLIPLYKRVSGFSVVASLRTATRLGGRNTRTTFD